MMEKEEIYDRDELCTTLISLIRDSTQTSAYILYSNPGVGKSSVSKKIAQIIEKEKITKDIIRIISAQDNHNIQEGGFLKNLFEYTRKYFLVKASEKKHFRKNKYYKYTFSYYMKSQYGFFDIKKVLDETGIEEYKKNFTNIYSIILYIFKLMLNYITVKLGKVKELENRNNYDDKIMNGYLKYILRKGDIVYCIDNTQNFDKTSLNIFTNILIDTKKQRNFIILEFTLLNETSNIILLDKIKSELNYSEISYNMSELDILDAKFALMVAKKHHQFTDPFFESRVIKNYKELYNGNIKKIENFAFNYILQLSNNSDPTFIKLDNLSSEQKYIMAIIILNNAVIKEDILKKVVSNSSEIYLSNYDKDLDYLICKTEFLEKRENDICIKHSDTIDTWNENIGVFNKYEALAYRVCENIFSRILENGIHFSFSRKECILLLFQLYNKFDAIKLNDILIYIDEIIYEFIASEELEEYLKKLISIIYLKESSLNILYNIFEVCSRHQLFDLEFFCLEKIKKILQSHFDEKYLFYYFSYLLQKEEYKLLLDSINEIKAETLSVDFKYYVFLYKMIAYTVLNNIDDSKQIVNELNQDIFFQTKKQYGYFLRLSEMYDKRNIAIPKVEKSIKVFKQFGMDIQAAKSQVSLAFLYSITGKLEMAQRALNAAEKVLLKNIENQHIFNINKACLYLLNGNFSDEVWELLQSAEKYAHIRSDCIAIVINKLILCIQNKKYEMGRYYEKKGLDLIELEYNHHLHAIFNYNCFVLYEKIGDKPKALKYYKLAEKYKNHCETLKARLEGKNQVEDNTTFLLQYPWHVCFVSYWYFDYIYDLK